MSAALLRRREVWWPTGRGWLLIGAAALALAALLVGLASQAYAWLAPTRPAHGARGAPARTLLVEGWVDDAGFDQAIGIYRGGGYARVLTSGGPIESWIGGPPPWPNYAERARRYLAAHGLPEGAITAIAAPPSLQERTYTSALAVRAWLRRTQPDLDAIDLVSAGPHARRTRQIYRLAFGPAVDVGVFATREPRIDPDAWWRSSEGAKRVLDELIALGWTTCCFWPDAAAR